MGDQGWWRWIKAKVSGLGWRLFMWGYDGLEEDYWREIYEQERALLTAVRGDLPGVPRRREDR
jgi:hypothetical protein